MNDNMTEKEWKEWLKNTSDEDLNESLQRVSKKEFHQENPNWEKDKAIMKAEKQRRRRAKNKAKPMGKKDGGFAKGSAEGSTIKMTPMKMKSGGLAKRGYGKARR